MRKLPLLICLAMSAGIPLTVKARQDTAAPEGGPAATYSPAPDTATDNLGISALPAVPLITPVLPVKREPPALEGNRGVKWVELSRAISRFLAVEHGFRLLTEPGTRAGLKGSFFRNYGRSVANLHGWADGDEFYVNYVGHPMQGSVAGFLFTQNDPAYGRTRFGAGRLYWKSRLRAAAFVWCYSTQFEIGPASEASIGAIQSLFPQQGFVDHVITPSIGLAWMIGEDAVDRYLIEPLEGYTTNRPVRLLVRSILNPTRTFSNFLNGRIPWSRDTRAGVSHYAPPDRGAVSSLRLAAEPAAPVNRDTALAPPFEFAVTFQPERLWGDGGSVLCLGGGANAAFRLAESWQFITEVGGCKMIGLAQNLSGDSLTYSAGPRWLGRIRGPWNAHLQFLVGGHKITAERMFPERKKLLEAAAVRGNTPLPTHGDYTEETESHGFAVSTGGGLSYMLNQALTIRVADLSYRHGWTGSLWGRDYGNSLKLTSGLVLRIGTW